RSTAKGAARLSRISRSFPCADTPTIYCSRACGNYGTTSRPMTPFTLLLPKRSRRRCSRATGVSPPLRDIAQPSSWCECACDADPASAGTLERGGQRRRLVAGMRPRANGVVAIFARQRGLAAAGRVIEVERIEFVSLRRRDREIGV